MTLMYEITAENWWYEVRGTDVVKFTVVDVRIKEDGDDITDTTHDEIVGKKIDLVGQVVPSGLSITSREWTVPGKRIADYVANDESGQVTPLTDLTSSSVLFFWVDGADGRVVEHSVVVEGIPCQGEATFDVKRPTAQIGWAKGTVDVYTYADKEWLSYGRPVETQQGMRFSRSLDIPQGFTGGSQCVQLVDYALNRIRYANGDWYRLEGSNGKDGPYPNSTEGECSDTPNLELLATMVEARIEREKYTMYLMFRPGSTGNISVPLRKLKWEWSAAAKKTQGQWSLDGTPSNPDPAESDCTDHPEWTENVSSWGWVQE